MSERDTYLPVVQAAAAERGIDWRILDALIQQESGYNRDVIEGRIQSSAGALGIAQFMPETARAFGINPLDPREAIDGAARYLSAAFETFGDPQKAIASYNAGFGGVQRAERIAQDEGGSWVDYLPSETRQYLPAVWGRFLSAIQGENGRGFTSEDAALTFPDPRKLFRPFVEGGEAVTGLVNALFDPRLWARLAFTLAGTGMIIVGVVLYTKPSVSTVAKLAAPQRAVAEAVAEGVS